MPGRLYTPIILRQPLRITTLSLSNAPVGAAYSATLAGAGGVPPYTWRLLSQWPGSWLSLNASTGVLSGTPPNPEIDILAIQLTDSTNTQTTAVLMLSTPTSVNANVISSTEIDLSWTAITGAVSYILRRNGSTIYTGSTPSFNNTGLTASTTYSYTVSGVSIYGEGAQSAAVNATTQSGSVATARASPIAIPYLIGGDQSYGCNASTSYQNWLTAPVGSAAYIAIQNMAAYDGVLIAGISEGTAGDWDSSHARPRNNLTLALAKDASLTYQIKLNHSRKTFAWYYHVMNEAQQSATGTGYDRRNQQLINMNGWVYTLAGGGGTTINSPAGGGLVLSNYSTAWPGAIGPTPIGSSVVGSAYGSLSTGSPTGAQGVARMNGNYAIIKIVMSIYKGDTRFVFNDEMGSKDCAGPMLDNAFYGLDGAGNISNACLDGVNIANGAAPAYPSLNTPQEVLARGVYNFFDQCKTMLATYGPAGSSLIPMANMGQYCNKSEFGTACLTGGLANMMVGGFIEASIGASFATEWRVHPSAPTGTYALQLKDNLYLLQDFLIDHPQTTRLPILMVILPPTSGTSTCQFPVLSGGVYTLQTVATNTALEYQVWRYALALAMLCGAVIGPSTHNYDYATLRYMAELGDDSLTLVNVPKGWMGQPAGPRPTAPFWAQGPMGVWMQTYTGGYQGLGAIAVWNPRGNGIQTVTLPATYQALNCPTQAPTINSGANFTTITLQDGDGWVGRGPIVTDGATISAGVLTVNKSAGGFGAKPTAAPLYFNDFEGQTVGDSYLTCGLNNINNDGTPVVVATDRAFSGSKSLKVVYPADGIGSKFPGVGKTIPNSQAVYSFCKMYWTLTAGVCNGPIGKLARCGAGVPYHGQPQRYKTIRPAGSLVDGGGDSGVVTPNKGTSYSQVTFGTVLGPVNGNVWNTLESKDKLATPGAIDGVAQDIVNGKDNFAGKLYNGSGTLLTGAAGYCANNDAGSTAAYQWAISAFDGWDVYGGSNAFAMWVDCMYYDTTLQCCVMTDNQVYASSSRDKMMIQIPTAWSDKSATFTYRNDGFTVGQTAWIHMFNASGVEVATYQVTVQ